MNRKHITSKRRIKRIERKGFRAAERAALHGARPRTLRTMNWRTPGSLRKDKLPIEEGN
jgi:hypothetical protein